jgi:hypothetical protein
LENNFRECSILWGFVNSNVSHYVINISFLSTTRERYYVFALALGAKTSLQGNSSLGHTLLEKGFQKGSLGIAIEEAFWVPCRTLFTEGSTLNPKGFYLEPKRVLQRVLLSGQPKRQPRNPFRF